MVAVGTADSASLIDGVHTFVTGLKNSKLNHEFIEVEGATHHQIVYEVVERAFDFLDLPESCQEFQVTDLNRIDSSRGQ